MQVPPPGIPHDGDFLLHFAPNRGADRRPRHGLWREFPFAAMYPNARAAADDFRVPASRVIELGTKLEI
jgi:K+ transporter